MADTPAPKPAQPARGGFRLVPVLALSCAASVALGVALVLVSIERTELGYAVRRLEGEVRTRENHADGLEVERGRLLSPYALEQKARELGMRDALPGQIRRMEAPARGNTPAATRGQ